MDALGGGMCLTTLGRPYVPLRRWRIGGACIGWNAVAVVLSDYVTG